MARHARAIFPAPIRVNLQVTGFHNPNSFLGTGSLNSDPVEWHVMR